MAERNENSSPEEDKELSHNALLKKCKEMLASLLDDPFLLDVSPDSSVKDVESLLALIQGKAITIHIQKFDGGIVCEYTNLMIIWNYKYKG